MAISLVAASSVEIWENTMAYFDDRANEMTAPDLDDIIDNLYPDQIQEIIEQYEGTALSVDEAVMLHKLKKVVATYLATAA